MDSLSRSRITTTVADDAPDKLHKMPKTASSLDTLPAAPGDGERRREVYLTRWALESLRLARCRNVRRNSVLRVSEVQ
jgi:hypothetical protein